MSVVEETTVSWHRVQSSEDIYYESANTGDYLLLNLNHSMTGLLEITVTFSSGDCEKPSAVEYFGNNYMCIVLLCIIFLFPFSERSAD